MHTKFFALILMLSTAVFMSAEVLENFSQFVRPSETVFSGSWTAGDQAPSSTMRQGDGFYEIRGPAAAGNFVDIFPKAGKTTHSFSVQTHLAISAKILSENKAPTFRVFLIDRSGNTAFASFETDAFSATAFSTITAPLSPSQNFNPGQVERIRISGDIPNSTAVLAVAFDELAMLGAGPSVTNAMRNFSAKARIGSGAEVLIVGFLVPGGSSHDLLLRAVGPGLAGFGLSNALADPKLQVFSGTTLSASNDNWSPSSVLWDAMARSGAFPLENGSRDAALMTTLSEGVQSVQISGASGSGPALFELYRLDGENESAESSWRNISARGYSAAGISRLVVGFVVRGYGIKKYLIRAAGPALANFGISNGFLADPKVQLMRNLDGKDYLMAENDNWGSIANQTALSTATDSVGAFRFASASKDSAMIVNLPAGIYTIVANSATNAEGIALIELFEVP